MGVALASLGFIGLFDIYFVHCIANHPQIPFQPMHVMAAANDQVAHPSL